MAHPLRDELTPEAKAWLANKFREMGLLYQPMNVEKQRFLNKHWSKTWLPANR